ncbi:MAG: hypothetical protein A2934_04385 [Candidatus Sungbacteria bacterium RIFCSPLOWO2_01_FULL_47_10]|uniref:Bifunctional protein FolD n=1 Tax=Candidatus Sungbacteria bacterium RIFCSPLOWO2_01_FULL_47_10 TaxID=1802276 RepID=A0A1G2L0A3_9BACT|nr:MAG: hypothetical protein A2934_04385 [Candidatus Sungbacteria bacterium RIFCSPLOWO2_01_FULL_47_10]
MILLDGKKLSQKILDELKQEAAGMAKKLRLAVVVVGKNPVVEKFIGQKRKAALSIGVDFRVYPFEETITTDELRKHLQKIVREKKNTGVVIQLPLPGHVSVQYILNSVIPEKDVDMLSVRSVGALAVGPKSSAMVGPSAAVGGLGRKNIILPPVAGAIKAFFDEYSIEYKNKNIVVVGAGKLVGLPVSLWLLGEKTPFGVVTNQTPDISEFTKNADIIISGAGRPKLITGDMVKKGVIIVDAGTSESEGRISGDADFESVSQKASYITPVPGGIGPVTIAMVFKNLVLLSKSKSHRRRV